MPSVLFICRGNIFRSPIAAVYFSKKLKDRQINDNWAVDSAGTWTQENIPVAALTVEFAASQGLQLREHVSQKIENVEIDQFDRIIVMEQGQKEALGVEFPIVADKTFILSEFSGMSFDVPDPLGQDKDAALNILAEVIDLIDSGFEQIIHIDPSGARK